jgi:hypothetical protein
VIESKGCSSGQRRVSSAMATVVKVQLHPLVCSTSPAFQLICYLSCSVMIVSHAWTYREIGASYHSRSAYIFGCEFSGHILHICIVRILYGFGMSVIQHVKTADVDDDLPLLLHL